MRDDVPVLQLPGNEAAIHWLMRANYNPDGAYGAALVDVDTYRHLLDLCERTATAWWGRRLPGVNYGTAGARAGMAPAELERILPDSYRGEEYGNTVVYRAGHPLAFTVEEIESALESAEDWESGDWGSADVAAITNPTFRARTWEIVYIANLLHWKRPLDVIQTIQLLKYEEGDGLGWHSDDPSYMRRTSTAEEIEEAREAEPVATAAMEGRTVSISAQLSDPGDYEGGGLVVKTEQGTITAPTAQGSVVVFLADVPHKVRQVTEGTRYSMTAFFAGQAPTPAYPARVRS